MTGIKTVKDISSSSSVLEFGYLVPITLVLSIITAITIISRIKTN